MSKLSNEVKHATIAALSNLMGISYTEAREACEMGGWLPGQAQEWIRRKMKMR